MGYCLIFLVDLGFSWVSFPTRRSSDSIGRASCRERVYKSGKEIRWIDPVETAENADRRAGIQRALTFIGKFVYPVVMIAFAVGYIITGLVYISQG